MKQSRIIINLLFLLALTYSWKYLNEFQELLYLKLSVLEMITNRDQSN